MSRSREKVNYLKKYLEKFHNYAKFGKFFIEIHLFLGFYEQTVNKNKNAAKISFLSLLSLEKQPPSVTQNFWI
jgi:hypothetical protein